MAEVNRQPAEMRLRWPKLLGRRGTLLAAGDVAALVLFAIVGRRSHEEGAGWSAVAGIAGTAAPFVVGWLVAGIALGAMSVGRTGTPRTMLRWTGLAWLGAFPLAAMIRALLLGRGSPWTFYVVAFSVALVMLAGWRLLFALAERRRRA